jgi:hypothetical protein
LLKAGYALHVFNRTAAKAENLLTQGALQRHGWEIVGPNPL